MGETTGSRRIRGAGAVAAALLAAAALTSCSQLAHAGAGGSAAPTAAADPSSVAPSADAPSEPAPIEATPAGTPPAVVAQDPAGTPSPSASADAGDRADVTPVITVARAGGGAVDVAAVVPAVVEAGGTCTAELTGAGGSRSATGPGVVAGSYTGCTSIHLAEVPAGTWQVRVRYASPTAAGVSKPQPVTVG